MERNVQIGQGGPHFYAMTAPLREALERVQSQLTTGQKAVTYAQMPSGTQAWLDFSASEGKADAYIDGIERHQLRLKMIDGTLAGLSKIAETTRTHLSGGFTAFQAGRSTASNALSMIVDLLNSKNGAVPLFGGGLLSGQVTLSPQAMIDGDATQPGLRTLINERIAADTGNALTGRIAVTSSAASLTLTAQGGVFGFQLKGASASRPDLTVSSVAGPPASMTLSSTAILQDGDYINVTLGLPHGDDVVMSLRAGQDFRAGRFDGVQIAQAVTTKLDSLTPALKTASAMKVAQDYFAGTVARVNGVPAQMATTQQTPTAIPWYLGQAHLDPRRSVQVAAGDQHSIAAGAQANETAFTDLLASVSAMAVLMDDLSMQSQQGQVAMQERLAPALSHRSLIMLQTEFGLVENQLATAKDVQKGIKAIASDYLADANSVDTTQAATELLTLQNQLQASYQAGVNILRLSLVNYL